ncbi:MAG: type II toxin-antitoxin system YafQ family toxin [Caldilineaceae bacterium]
MLRVRQSTQFKRDIKRLKKQGLDLSQLEAVVKKLIAQEVLERHYRDHPFLGNRKGYRECHIEPDWLLIYRIEGDELQLAETGSHADLFG